MCLQKMCIVFLFHFCHRRQNLLFHICFGIRILSTFYSQSEFKLPQELIECVQRQRQRHRCKQPFVFLRQLRFMIDTGCFFLHWYPPKKLKYGKPRLGESMLAQIGPDTPNLAQINFFCTQNLDSKTMKSRIQLLEHT